MSEQPSPRPSRRAAGLALEALVVFLGVTAAFLLDGCRERAAEERRRAQILGTLAEDCEEAAESLDRARGWFDGAIVEPFLEPYGEGASPPLLPIPFPTGEGAQSWESMLAAGGVDVLEIDLIRSIDRLVTHANVLNSQAEGYNDYLRTVLVPALDRPPTEFYGEDGRLRQKYLWYYYSLAAIDNTLDLLAVDTEACRELVAPARRPAP